jgi:hypothetical protein
VSNTKKSKIPNNISIPVDSSSAKAFEQLSPKSLEERVQKELKMISNNKISRWPRGSDETSG